MLRLAAAAIVVVGLAVPATAQTVAEDTRSCSSGEDTVAERIEACTRAIESGEAEGRSLARLLEGRGDLLIEAGAYEDAIADFEAAIGADPTNRTAGPSRALALLHLGRIDEALVDLDTAIEVNSRYAESRYLRGLAYAAMGDADRAIDEFAEAYALDPNFALALIQRGRVLIGEGRLDEARADLETALEIEPFNARAFAGLGLAADFAGDEAGAIRNYRLAQMIDPNLYPLSRLAAFQPVAAEPDGGDLAFTRPAPGLTIEYRVVETSAGAEAPNAGVEIGDRLFWLAGAPDQPVPDTLDAFRWVFGETDEEVVEASVSRLYNNSGPFDQPTSYTYAFLPIRSPLELRDGVSFVNRGLDAIWDLEPGETASGDGRAAADCPEDPDPFAEARGCMMNVPNVRVGTYDWNATFVGWEYVLVPAGYRLAARIDFALVSTIGFDDPEPVESTISFWYDPSIGWWVKRVTTEEGTVETVEAVWIEEPPPAEDAPPAE